MFSALFSWDCKRWILAAAAVVLPAAVLHAALPAEPPGVSAPSSLAGQLLIASPRMREPFDHAVILMAQHSRDGALGIVINHPIDSRPIADVLKALGADASGIKNSVRVFLGGPVSPNIAFVIHSADYRRDDTVDIDGHVALSDAAEVLRDIGIFPQLSNSNGSPLSVQAKWVGLDILNPDGHAFFVTGLIVLVVCVAAVLLVRKGTTGRWRSATFRSRAWSLWAMPAGGHRNLRTRSRAVLGSRCRKIRQWFSTTIETKCGPTPWRCTSPAGERGAVRPASPPHSLIYSNQFLTPPC